ncbi:23S rRNA (uracil(1939)-C(5))-methyltransferase RlmD [Pusillimonas sp. (ex Stolz et al. 2005)]|uniref:23S rRNA (uracil(1939)-C(5))-methyltransferase RlmD n=1 Tax=Pusillimonas sp. (ex Stolz et al. 2005) TaxID=1979962 RepID=UPI0026277942|nr:23S rRNA (uracil(1939)-C(5))-methyltransferase RlmD [Pusillimonas sp. (ex Stolz et al. 2005)]
MDVIDLDIDVIDERGQGLANRGSKTYFVSDALPGERVTATIERDKGTHAIGRVQRILRASPARVMPRCPHFGVCGGCLLQHIEPGVQVALKQRALEKTFARVAGLRPARMLSPIHGPDWNYRFRARLAVRYVPTRGGVLLGFHERKSSYVADIQVCLVMPKVVSDLLMPLHDLIARLSIPHRIPHIQVAVGDDFKVALVLRHLLPLTETDIRQLNEFSAEFDVQWWLQPGGQETAAALLEAPAGQGISPAAGRESRAADAALTYLLPEFGLQMRFRPTDFIQANLSANRALVSRAVSLLQPMPNDRVLDLFCGLGNFTLPVATLAREVVGVEASEALLDKARQIAADHGLASRVRLQCADLFRIDSGWLEKQGEFDLMVLDPPREGARAVVEAMATRGRRYGPRRIVYVSCNPATLARDAAILVHKGKYRLTSSVIVNMFPHTLHVESISVFE